LRPFPTVWVAAAFLVAVLIVLALTLPAAGEAWTHALVWIQEMQRYLHDRLAEAVRAADRHGPLAAAGLIGLSFLYGVFHAAGPGHGKVVIATYLLTQESDLKRGVVLSFLSALVQGVVAIVAVVATVAVLDLPLRDAKQTAGDFETVSYAAVLLLGAVLTFSAVRRLTRRIRRHGHHHHHGEHGAHDDCGHVHAPAPASVASWRQGVAVIASVGLRPCSGAILVLLLAFALHLTWSGIAAVLAMSVGTALTVSVLATLAVYARGFSIRLARHMPESRTSLAGVIDAVALLGGLVVLALGAALLHAALTVPTHPLMP
jgi:ABC-type nickel/cobalt efflux system permease component RcnA